MNPFRIVVAAWNTKPQNEREKDIKVKAVPWSWLWADQNLWIINRAVVSVSVCVWFDRTYVCMYWIREYFIKMCNLLVFWIIEPTLHI